MCKRLGKRVNGSILCPEHGRILRCVLALGILISCCSSPVYAGSPPWLEPRALHIVDIAGQVPDEVLRDNIIAYNGSGGIAQFISSQSSGDLLRLTVRLYPRRWGSPGNWITTFVLLGQLPAFDQMGSVAPESWVRLYSGRTELTSRIVNGMIVSPALALPLAGAAEAWRYPQVTLSSLSQEANGRKVPANYGGHLNLLGDYRELIAVFTVRPQGRPQVTYLGTQVATFQSYIGPGGVGVFQPLMEQLLRRYPWRHPRIRLNIPEGANYVLFTYPPMPFDVYDTTRNNLDRPIAGSVRLAPDEGMLSQDLTHGGAFPLRVAWQDADQVIPGPYLSLLPPIDRVTPPEYVVPAGITYDPCFLTGNCSQSVLESIYNATMTLRIIYLKVEPRMAGLRTIPLRAADDTWRPQKPPATFLDGALPFGPVYKFFLPLGLSGPRTTERPAGLFEPVSGRMVGYLP